MICTPMQVIRPRCPPWGSPMDENRPATRALMACLGEPSRFQLVRALIGGARCVTDLAAEVGLSQSCTTRHLQALERRSVVRGTRDGKRVLYRIRNDRADLMPLIAWAMEAHAASGGRPTRPAARASILSPDGPLVATRVRAERNGRTAAALRLGAPPVARRRLGQPPGQPPGQSPGGPVPAIVQSPVGARAPENDSAATPAMTAREPEPVRARRPNTELEDFLL